LIISQSYRHGAAFVILPSEPTSGLNIKYPLRYDRIPKLLSEHARLGPGLLDAHQKVFDIYEKGQSTLPTQIHREIAIGEAEQRDAEEALAGCVRTVAATSQVDGVVAVNRSLEVIGFGAEITEGQKPRCIFSAEDEEGSKKLLKPLDYEHYGTRHRSMLRLCNSCPGSIGFVISQDGDIRAMCKAGDAVLVWSNIQVRESFT